MSSDYDTSFVKCMGIDLQQHCALHPASGRAAQCEPGTLYKLGLTPLQCQHTRAQTGLGLCTNMPLAVVANGDAVLTTH